MKKIVYTLLWCFFNGTMWASAMQTQQSATESAIDTLKKVEKNTPISTQIAVLYPDPNATSLKFYFKHINQDPVSLLGATDDPQIKALRAQALEEYLSRTKK